MRTSRGSRSGAWFAYAVLCVATLVALFPVFWTLSTSIKDRRDTFVNPPKIVNFDPTTKNYRLLFGNPAFVRVTLNTFLVTAGATALSVSVGSLAAYALVRHRRFPGRRSLEATMVIARAVPGVVLIVPLFEIVTRLRVYDDLWALIVIYAAVNLPFAVWLMTSFFQQVPFELEESALVDGAGRLQVLRMIVLPLAAPGLAATAIFVALLCWNEFLIPALLAGERSKTLPVFISGFISARNLDWGPMAAASSLAIVPIALITVVLQRRLVAGLSAGAVKE